MYQFVINVLYFTIVGLFAVSFFTLRKWGGRVHAYLFFYCVSNLVYNCAYVLIMGATDQQTYVTALKIGYLGRVWIGLSMLLFITELCGTHFPVALKTAGAVINMIIYFFILNLERTGLYYKRMEYVKDGDFPTLPHSGGPLYYMFTLINLIYAFSCTYLMIRACVREKNETVKKRNLMLAAVMISLGASYIIYFFKLIPLARKFDVMIIGYALCTVFMLIAIIKYRMLDTTEAARDYVVDELSEGIIAVDTEDKISYFNKPALKLFPGLDDPEKSVTMAPKLLFDLEKAIRSGEPVRIDEKILTPRANPLTENGTKIGTLYSLSDDSEHYRYLDELREQKQIADNANESKSQFLANMSHEIRTPINAVLGLNEMILRECDKVKGNEDTESPAVKEAFANIGEYSGNIEGAGNNLLSIINGILDISKIEAGKMDIVDVEYDLKSLLKDINDMILFRAAEKGLEFLIDVDETLPGVLYGDRVRIRQVITNILTNAVKYTDNGTVRLTVSTKNADRVKEGDILELTAAIQDTGIGIRREDMDKLFDKFQRFELDRNSSIEGTGLGLAIARQLVSMMGGNIKVDSEYGHGSTFTVTIPQKVISAEPVGNLKVRTDNVSDDKNSGKADDARHPYKPSFTAPDALVLIVDDSKVNLIVAKALLKDTGVKTDTADGGSKAVELAGQKAYDLILMDQRMPNMDGTEALNLIRKQEGGPNVETPVICMTADAIIGAKERYMEEGFDDYLSKPINSHELEQTMLKYLPKDKVRER